MMYEEKEHKTNDRPAPPRTPSRPSTTLPSTSKPRTSTSEDEGDLLMRHKIDLECDVLVIDIGTHSIKAGWAGEDTPRLVMPSVIVEAQGRGTAEKRSMPRGDESTHRRFGSALPLPSSSLHVGSAALTFLSSLDDPVPPPSLHVIHPIHRSLIINYDALSLLLNSLFSELHCNPKDHSILLTYPPLASPADRLSLARLFFDQFNVPALLLINSASLSLFSTGSTCGMVVEMGEGRVTVTPVFEGFALRHAMVTQPVGGEDVTSKLLEMLRSRGHAFRWNQMEIVRDMKEKLCKLKTLKRSALHSKALKPQPPSTQPSNASTPKAESEEEEEDTAYELPSGEMIHLDDSCIFEPLEVLFTGEAQPPTDPSISQTVQWTQGVKEDESNDELSMGRSRASTSQYRSESTLPPLPVHLSSLSSITRVGAGVGRLIEESLSMVDEVLRGELRGRVVLAGGVSMGGGVGDRVKGEVEGVEVVCDSQRMYASWIGGSMFGSLSTFGQMKITADAWKKDETIIHKLCM